MTMWNPYLAAIREHVPEAEQKTVFYRFHLMAHTGKAFDTVHKREHRMLEKGGDETLTGSKYR
jgi:hypothetical protein